MVDRALELYHCTQHSDGTCGQSRRGGVGTSNCGRRSRSLGRVAVTHVQGPPKGGGALGPLRVPNTRLCRCLRTEEVLMMHMDRIHHYLLSIRFSALPSAMLRRAGR